MGLRCPRCGIPFKTLLSRSKVFACRGCGAIFNDRNELCSNVQKGMARVMRRHPFLRIGLQGKLNGEPVTLSARIHYRVQCEEWDAEDGIYTNEDWTYDEWVLCSAQAEYYLSEYEGELTLQMPMGSSPLTRIDWTASTLPLEDGQQSRVLVRGIAAMVGMEGEVPWELPDTGTLHVLEYQDDKQIGAVEADIDDDGVAEPEFYLGEPIPADVVAAMFGVATPPVFTATTNKHTVTRRTHATHTLVRDTDGTFARKSWGVVYLLVGVLMLLGGLMANSTGNRIFQETVDAKEWVNQPAVGPIEMTVPGALYEIRITGNVPHSANAAWLAAELQTEADEVINTVESDMWREGGESNTSDSKVFQLEQAGRYYLRLDGELGNLSFPASIAVYEGVTLARYIIISAGVLLLIALLLLLGENRE